MTDDELLTLARKATQLPWEHTNGVVWIDTHEQVCCGRSYYECCGQPDIRGGQEKIADSNPIDAEYIAAANPSAIIALIERHRAERNGFEMVREQMAATIARHVEEKDALRAEVSNLTKHRDDWHAAADDWADKANELRAEVERLRSFLSEGDQQRLDSEFAWKSRAEAAESALAAAQKRIVDAVAIIDGAHRQRCSGYSRCCDHFYHARDIDSVRAVLAAPEDTK